MSDKKNKNITREAWEVMSIYCRFFKEGITDIAVSPAKIEYWTLCKMTKKECCFENCPLMNKTGGGK